MEDEGGQVYYYNEATGESRWEQPEEEEVPNPSPNLPWARRDHPARTLIPNANPDPDPHANPTPRGRAPPS